MYKYCIFLDVDGVLNHQLFYHKYRDGLITKEDRRANIDKDSISLVNDLIERLGGVKDVLVVMSSTWRNNYDDVREHNELFHKYGAIWDFFEKTGNSDSRIRGVEIYQWLEKNSRKYFNVNSSEFKNFIILDDDSDMLLWQRENFFQIDTYCGITYNTVHKILRKFGKKEY